MTNIEDCVISACTVKESLTAQNISAQLCHVPVRNRSLEVQLIGPILCFFAIAFVVIRVIARRPFVSDLFGWDDGLIVAAALVTTPSAVTQVLLGRNGLGKDIWTVPFDHITQMLRLMYVAEVFYTLSTALTRISILVFYLRVFSGPRFRVATKIMIGFNIAGWVATFFPIAFQCTPISYAWTRWSEETQGHCINLHAGTWTLAAFNILFDLTALILPLPALYQLQLTYSWKKKARVFVMFSIGLIATLVSILRLRSLVYFGKTRNPTWDLVELTIWSVTESKVGIICACLPMAAVFFTRLAPQWLGMTVAASTRNIPTPGVRDAPDQWTNSTVSGAGSTHRLSKPPQRASVVIMSIPEESENGDLVHLADLEHNKSFDYGIGTAR